MTNLQRRSAQRSNIPDDAATSLTIVVVTYRSERYIAECLESVERAAPPEWQVMVYVVDNSEGNECESVVRSQFPAVTFIKAPGNIGFARANNIVLRECSSQFVLLLNPDTRMNDGVLRELLGWFTEDPKVGIVGCRLVRADGTFDHASKRNLPDATNAVAYFLSKLFRLPSIRSNYGAPAVGERDVGSVGAINGAFMLIRTEAMHRVGLLDEAFWMYGEDLDWCKRFGDDGWKIIYDGTKEVLHRKGASSGKYRSLRVNWHFHRSMQIYLGKHGPQSAWTKFGLYIPIYIRFACSAVVSAIVRFASSVISSVKNGDA